MTEVEKAVLYAFKCGCFPPPPPKNPRPPHTVVKLAKWGAMVNLRRAIEAEFAPGTETKE